MSANSDQLAKFLKAHRDFKLSGNKVRCESTGHELVADVEAIKKYMAGKKYKKLAQWYSYDFNKYKSNYIYPGRTPKTMYCQVTKMTLNKIPSEIENHIRGKKYKSALATYEARLERTKQANLKKQKEWGNNKKTHVAPVADPNMMTDIAEAPEDGVDFGLLSRIVGEDKNEESEDDMEDLIPGFKKNAGDDEDDDDMEDVLEDVVEDEMMESDEIEAEDVDEDEVSAEEELMDEDSIEDLIALPSYDVSETYNRVIDMLSERAMEKKKQKAAAKEQEASKKKQLEKVPRTKKVDLDARKEKESKSKKEKDSKKDKESSKKDKKSKKDKQSSVEEQEEKKQEQKTDKKSKKSESSKTESNKSKSTKMDSDSDSDEIPELIPIVEMKFAGFPVKKSKEQQKKSHGAQANQKSKPNWDAGLQPSRKAPKNQKMDTTQSKVKSGKKK